MMDFLKKLFGKPYEQQPLQVGPSAKPSIPQAEIDRFVEWFESQSRPAVGFVAAKDQPRSADGSRLAGPAWIADGEEWPCAKNGVPLEFLFQLDCADCAALDGYPSDTILQFFVGRSDLYGCDFDRLVTGDFLVHARSRSDKGALQSPPPLEVVNDEFGSDFSPIMNLVVRTEGIAFVPELYTDTMDWSLHEVASRIDALHERYDITKLEDWIEGDGDRRASRHHTGGYPAFTQSDITASETGRPFDHVLLNLTADDHIMFGDSGECVFLIRKEDLRRGDFSRVAYSWDCC